MNKEEKSFCKEDTVGTRVLITTYNTCVQATVTPIIV